MLNKNIIYSLVVILIIFYIDFYIQKQYYINSLRYGDIWYNSIKKYNYHNFKYINIPIDKIYSMMDSFPENNSTITKEELKYLQYRVNNIKNYEIKNFSIHDTNSVHLLNKFIQSKKLKINKAEYSGFLNEMEIICYILKDKFNRPRPYQLGHYIGVPINAHYSESAHSGSYPSGHSLLANCAALYLSKKYPIYKKDFVKKAYIIEDSRVCTGLHYKSDNIASRKLAHKITNLLF